MTRSRYALLALLLLVVVAGSWWFFRSRQPEAEGTLAVYCTQLDGTTMHQSAVSMRPPGPGESADEHRHNQALYAAVQAVAGPPSDTQCIRFPSGTRVLGVNVSGKTATVDLSDDVARQVGGSFTENGAFKGLVYTVTGIPGIDAVAVTIAGKRVDTLPGGHLELDQPLRRSDF